MVARKFALAMQEPPGDPNQSGLQVRLFLKYLRGEFVTFEIESQALFDHASASARLLGQGAAPAPGSAERIRLEAQSKAVLLVVLAERCPAQRATLLATATRLNYRRGFPHHFLARTIA